MVKAIIHLIQVNRGEYVHITGRQNSEKCTTIESSRRHAHTIASLQLFLLAFADDLVLIAPSPIEL